MHSCKQLMKFPTDVFMMILKYLSKADVLALLLTNKSNYCRIKSCNLELVITSDNIKVISKRLSKQIRYNKILIKGDFENLSDFHNIFKFTTCTLLEIDSSIIFNSNICLPSYFTENVQHLCVVDDALEVLDLSTFTSLSTVTLRKISKGQYTAIRNFPRIQKIRFIECDFKIRSEYEDYVFGNNNVLDTIRSKFATENITEVEYENSKATFGSIVFELYSMNAILFPKIKKYTMRYCTLSGLEPFTECRELEYLKIENHVVKWQGLKFGNALKHLYLIADSIYIDKCISLLKLKNLKIICQTLVSTSVILKMPDCDNIKISTKNGKVVKASGKWYYYNKLNWIEVVESDALACINQ
eukprot:NODE_122_length_18870_cov_0.236908.p3 type:complete len:357 gc:universal NODE_122_length_18870_cov_0.236908:1708-2778(+)